VWGATDTVGTWGKLEFPQLAQVHTSNVELSMFQVQVDPDWSVFATTVAVVPSLMVMVALLYQSGLSVSESVTELSVRHWPLLLIREIVK
jgi:hypothetical protein